MTTFYSDNLGLGLKKFSLYYCILNDFNILMFWIEYDDKLLEINNVIKSLIKCFNWVKKW
jgi:hypothetical protein